MRPQPARRRPSPPLWLKGKLEFTALVWLHLDADFLTGADGAQFLVGEELRGLPPVRLGRARSVGELRRRRVIKVDLRGRDVG